MLFSPQTQEPEAAIDGAALTALRTGAVSGLATRYLALEDAARLVIFGAGTQARAHLEAMLAVRPIERVTFVSRTAARAEALAGAAREMGLAAEVGGPEAVGAAHIVCTCTTSPTPVFDGSRLSEGAHVNAVGAYTPETRELDEDAIRRGRVVVETREVALAEAGDLLIPLGAGSIGPDHIVADLSEVVRGRDGSSKPRGRHGVQVRRGGLRGPRGGPGRRRPAGRMTGTADVVVVGGGVVGASAAYHLAAAGAGRVLLLEREDALGTGSTGACAGGFRHQFSSEINIRLSLASVPMILSFQETHGIPLDVQQDGYLFLVRSEASWRSFVAAAELQRWTRRRRQAAPAGGGRRARAGHQPGRPDRRDVLSRRRDRRSLRADGRVRHRRASARAPSCRPAST